MDLPVPKIDAIRNSFSCSFPDHFPDQFVNNIFVYFSNILPPDTDLMLTPQYLRPEWGVRGNWSGWSDDHP